ASCVDLARKPTTGISAGLHRAEITPTGTPNYFAAKTPAPTSDSKIFIPSVPPSSDSLARSGCGIIPRTLRPGLQMPAMLSRDPLGLDSAVISPAASQ